MGTSPSSENSSDDNTTIVIAAAGGAAGAVFLCLIVGWFLKRNKSKTNVKEKKHEAEKSQEMVPGESGDGIVTIGMEGDNKEAIEVHASEARPAERNHLSSAALMSSCRS